MTKDEQFVETLHRKWQRRSRALVVHFAWTTAMLIMFIQAIADNSRFLLIVSGLGAVLAFILLLAAYHVIEAIQRQEVIWLDWPPLLPMIRPVPPSQFWVVKQIAEKLAHKPEEL